jgi:hypothetical protein
MRKGELARQDGQGVDGLRNKCATKSISRDRLCWRL